MGPSEDFSGAAIGADEREPGSCDKRLMSHLALRFKGSRYRSAGRTEARSAGLSFIITPRRLRSTIIILIGVCWGWTRSKSKTLTHRCCGMTFVFVFRFDHCCCVWRSEVNNQAARMITYFTYAQRGWIIQLWGSFERTHWVWASAQALYCHDKLCKHVGWLLYGGNIYCCLPIRPYILYLVSVPGLFTFSL